MLAGELYFYNKNEEVIKKMDLLDYEEMSKEKFIEFLNEIDCFKATLHGYYHNHQQNPTIKVIYEKQKRDC
jgi:hypothetical protein